MAAEIRGWLNIHWYYVCMYVCMYACRLRRRRLMLEQNHLQSLYLYHEGLVLLMYNWKFRVKYYAKHICSKRNPNPDTSSNPGPDFNSWGIYSITPHNGCIYILTVDRVLTTNMYISNQQLFKPTLKLTTLQMNNFDCTKMNAYFNRSIACLQGGLIHK